MRTYELTLVLTEAASSSDKKIIQKVASLLKAYAKVKDTKVRGIRELAYPIKKATKGGYVSCQLEMDGEKIQSLEKEILQDEQILRHLLIIKEERNKKR